MHLHTVVVPPRHILDEVVAAVQAATLTTAAAPGDSSPPRRRGVLQRVRRRDAEGTATAGPRVPALELDHLAAEAMTIPLAGFGNVTRSDAGRLAAALRTAAAAAPVSSVRLAGGTALEFAGDRCVWARLEGEIDSLTAMARTVTQTVEQLGFYVDRRKFRPMLAVASVNDATTATRLEAVVEALDAFSSETWTVDHILLMRASYESSTGTEEVARLPLQG